jgi:cytochrome c oxidase subunit 2
MARRYASRHPVDFRATTDRPVRRRVPAQPAAKNGLPLWLRVGVFATTAIVVGIVAVNLVIGRLQPPGTPEAGALQVHASMDGFDPNQLTVKAGQEVKLQLASMDTSMHSDGGGWHEFAIDALKVDFKVGPESSQVFTFTAPATAGTYQFYCDICCGGKANPSMQGKLTVTA